MNKKLFDKIIGADFTITNFKVNSRKDLYMVLEQQHLDLNQRLHNENSEEYEFAPEELTPENVGFHSLMVNYNMNHYFKYCIETKHYAELIIKRLRFTHSPTSKIALLNDELKALGQQFSDNPYNPLLTPDNYFNEIRTYEFYSALWIYHRSLNFDQFLTFKKEYKNRGFDKSDLMEENLEEQSLHYFFRILQRYTILKLMLIDVEEDMEENLTEKVLPIPEKIKINNYPKVFKNGYALELFNYLVSVEKKHIGPSWIYKYFSLFKDENLIKSTSKPSDFLTYMKKEHGKEIDINQWDSRTGFNKEHELYLKDIEIDFKNLHNVS